MGIPSEAEQAVGKGMFSNEHCEKHTSGAKALVDSAGLVPGLKSRPTARTSFSAACKAVPFQSAEACKAVPFQSAHSSRNNLNPFALAHQGFGDARGGDAVDVQLAGADHPVDVDEAVVRAPGGKLLGGQLVSVAQT
jgi:hypothetical protein